MKGRLAWRLALRNLSANRSTQIPFVLSTSVMSALFYIMVSLSKNEYIVNRHEFLPTLVNIGSFMVAIFALVFLLYANRFNMKKRHKELALYEVLGLEKKHIAKILRRESWLSFLLCAFLGTSGGYLLGQLAFRLLNIFLHDKTAGIMDYPWSWSVAAISCAFLACIFSFVLLMNLRKIKQASAVDLFREQTQAEAAPRNKPVALICGFLSLGAGYYFALTVQGRLNSIPLFFVMVALVLLGTYLLFSSLGTAYLLMLKKRKAYYYQTKNFLSVSGMLYRMRTHAAGLASMALMSTAMVIALATSASLYYGLSKSTDNLMPRQYSLALNSENWGADSVVKADYINKTIEELKRSGQPGAKIKAEFVEDYIFVGAVKRGDALVVMKKGDLQAGDIPLYVNFTTMDSMVARTGTEFKLQPGEIYISSNAPTLLSVSNLALAGETYTCKPSPLPVASNIAIESYSIVVADEAKLRQMSDYYQVADIGSEEMRRAPICTSLHWDLDGEAATYKETLTSSGFLAGKGVFEVKAEKERFVWILNGGLVFIGLIISLVFLVGLILINYYKQMSEGQEDRSRFSIMQKVGLDDNLIRQTAGTQLRWLFLLPLLVAVLHVAIASRIMVQLLGLFGITDHWIFIIAAALLMSVFALIYFLMFKLGSRVYCKLVS